MNYAIVCVGMAVTFYYLLPSTTQRIQVDPLVTGLSYVLKKPRTWVFLAIVFFNGFALALAFR